MKALASTRLDEDNILERSRPLFTELEEISDKRGTISLEMQKFSIQLTTRWRLRRRSRISRRELDLALQECRAFGERFKATGARQSFVVEELMVRCRPCPCLHAGINSDCR